MRFVMALLVGLLALAGCGDRAPAPAAPVAPASAPAQANALATYLRGAELQAENDEQRRELRRALADLASKPADELRAARYAGPAGAPAQRDLAQVLRAHLVPATPAPLDAERLFEDAASPEARAAIQERIGAIDRSLAAASAPAK